MRQLVQNYKTGQIEIKDIPCPKVSQDQILVQTINSVVSLGSETTVASFAQKSLLAKAKSRPDLVRQVFVKARKEGFINTYKEAMNRLDEPLPLGYSSVGKVVEAGERVQNIKVGDRVAIFGVGLAPHAEYTAVPENLVVKLPSNVDSEVAAFVSLGAIAINGIRHSQQQPGARVAVIGLGMIGFLTALILKAYNYNVTVFDISEKRLERAREAGLKNCYNSAQAGVGERCLEITQHKGFEAVIITAASRSNEPIELATKISRFRGRIVLVGVVGLDIQRQPFYEKEMEFVVSKDAGPKGALDDKRKNDVLPDLEWTQKSNLQEFINLLAREKIDIKPLITQRVEFAKIEEFYHKMLDKGQLEDCLGVLIQYPDRKSAKKDVVQITPSATKSKLEHEEKIEVGIIGSGQFARNIFLPILFKNQGVNLKAVATARGVSAEQIGRKYQADYVTTDHKKVIKDPNINTVFILTRHNSHAPMVIEALKSSKNVFVEKPLCINERELKQLNSAYLSINALNCSMPVIMVGFNRRFSEFSKAAKEFLAKNGQVSKVITIRANAGYIPKDHWSQILTIGGGRIIGEVCHYIDLINYFTDSYPVATCASVKSDSINNDNLVINLEYSDGSIANICYCSNGTKSFPRERIEIFSNQTICVIDDFKSMEFAQGSLGKKKRKFNKDMGYRQEIKDFLNACANKGKQPVEFNDYLSTTLATFKILESIEKKQRVTFDYKSLNL